MVRQIHVGRALGAAVLVVAVLNTLAAVSMPVAERRPGLGVTLLWLALLALHAAAYRFGEAVRERLGLGAYAGAQTAILLSIALTRTPVPTTTGVFMAATAELVVLAGSRWGTVRITTGAIALYVLARLFTADLYRAAAAGLMLALTGMLAHAAAGLLNRRAPGSTEPDPRGTASQSTARDPGSLSPREVEVLRELVAGARNNDIAGKLGISERTVKAHLGSIYQKLGVDTRAGAVGAALHRGLV